VEAAVKVHETKTAAPSFWRVTLGLLLVLQCALPAVAQDHADATPEDSGEALRLRVKPLPEGVRRVRLESDGQGGRRYLLEMVDGSEKRLSPEAFADLLARHHRGKGFLFRLLNISGPVGFAWVALGLLGQLLFTGRMVLQWLVSEHRRRSVVPVGFWWMSLIGASMLLVYFVWRRDIVGVLGQSAGWIIYSRNLWLIYAERRAES
jgi:lipid-A-disaccharide synthase-like uncharacterized protein